MVKTSAQSISTAALPTRIDGNLSPTANIKTKLAQLTCFLLLVCNAVDAQAQAPFYAGAPRVAKETFSRPCQHRRAVHARRRWTPSGQISLQVHEQGKTRRRRHTHRRSLGHSLYTVARLFAYMFDLKEPRFVTGYMPRDQLGPGTRNEIGARVSILDSFLTRNAHRLDKLWST